MIMKDSQKFKTLDYAIRKADSVLLFAHSRPDGDTAGSCAALWEYIKNMGKKVDIACFDPMPEYLSSVVEPQFQFPSHLNIKEYKLIIACDSVERGFQKVVSETQENQVIALIDHHPDITMKKDINIIKPEYSSVCEIIYDFLYFSQAEINRPMASYLLLGILSDTGMFQHSNTSPRVMEIASFLMKKGAPLSKIVNATFSNKKISTLKLWGKAFEKARINPKTGMIASVLTKEDVEKCNASSEDIGQVANILNSVPGTNFSLILTETEEGMVKGSLRSEEYKNIDVSQIAKNFGGGGHKLASGFEIKGKIEETSDGWKII